MKKLISILTTAAICAAAAAPVMSADEKLTAEDVKKLLCANGLQNHPELLECDAIIQNPQIGGWEKDIYKLKDIVDTGFSYRGYGMVMEYCESRWVDFNNERYDQADFTVLDKNGYITPVSVFSDDYGIEEYRGKIYLHNYPTDDMEPYSDESFSFLDVNGESYGYEKIAEIINAADIGKVNLIAFSADILYIRSDNGEYVIPCEPSYDLSAAYLGREEMSYEKGVLIPFDEYEKICVNIDKNDRDDPRDIKFAVDKTQNVTYHDDSMKGDKVRDTNTRAAYIDTDSIFGDVDNRLVSYINELSDLGIITGYDDGSFRPDGTLTRAEAAAMICRMMHYSAEYDGRFADVPADAWYTSELAALVKKGIINGTSDNTFSPDDPIKYVDILKIIVGVLGYASNLPNDDYEEWVIDKAMKIGLITGIDSFETQASARRGNIAIIISNALDTHIHTYITEVSGGYTESSITFEIGREIDDITLIDYINGGKLNGEIR